MNCQNNIEKIKDVVQSEEFYYKKLQDIFEEFKNYQISQDNLENLIKNLDFKPFSFDEYLKNNSSFNDFILLIGQIIAMCDLNGYNKQEWNLYKDKRIIAKAGVRQNDWVRNLLHYKLYGNNTDNLTNSVKNALLFIDSPENNLTQLSINHKKLVASNLLNITFDESSYFEQLKYYFKDELTKYELRNQKNFGLLLSLFVYCEEIRNLWDKNFDYWLVGSNWDGVDKTDDFIQNGTWENGYNNEYLERVKSVKIGDKIAIKSSYTKTKSLPFDNQNKTISVMKIKAIGEVVNNQKDGKRLEVAWDSEFEPKEIFGFSYRNTMSKIDKEKWKEPIKWIFEGKEQDDFFSFNAIEEKDNNEEKMLKNTKQTHQLNQILFGPPGTGKTYHTIDKALEIIDGEVPSDRSEAKERFEELKSAGQIEFVTFHQSYGYEEFVEGIKAIPSGKEGNENGEEMIYDICDGIFKKLSKKSLEQFSKSNILSHVNKKRFVLNAKSLNIQAELIQDDDNNFRVLNGSKIRKGEAESFKNYNYSDLKNTVLKEAKLKEESEFYILEEDYTFQSLSAASSVILGRMSNGLIDWKEIFDDNNLLAVNDGKQIKNYILIIDEINRGNISKIFGELITLIEPSKRIGAEEEIRARLPYSGDDFGVPSNLYIIGTMNTADRSIALMDTALRRRFEFVEMLPDLETLNGLEVEEINIKSMLETINKRVEYLYDRDHTIGNAYFIDIKSKNDLDSVMRNKVIPLLSEYFYDDWEKILMVLGDGFVEKVVVKDDIFDYKVDDYLEDEKYVYTIKKDFDYSKFTK